MGFFDRILGPRPVNVELTPEQAEIVKSFEADDWARLQELSQPVRGQNGQFQSRTPVQTQSVPDPNTNRNGLANQYNQLSPVQQLLSRGDTQYPNSQVNSQNPLLQPNNGFQNPHTPSNVYQNSLPIAEEINRMGHDGVKNLTDEQAAQLREALISEAQQTGSLG